MLLASLPPTLKSISEVSGDCINTDLFLMPGTLSSFFTHGSGGVLWQPQARLAQCGDGLQLASSSNNIY